MNLAEHLLTILAEEATEVAHRCTKALRFGLDEVEHGQPLNNASRILVELADLHGAVRKLEQAGLLMPPSYDEGDMMIRAKVDKIDKFLAYSKEVGTLTP